MIFSPSAFHAWAASQPPEMTYRPSSPTECALCQFLNDTGLTRNAVVGTTIWRECGDEEDRPLPEWANTAVQTAPHDFGSLAIRLERLLVDELVMA
jgi:hypothetical protein